MIENSHRVIVSLCQSREVYQNTGESGGRQEFRISKSGNGKKEDAGQKIRTLDNPSS
jgi:hypothetical protein